MKLSLRTGAFMLACIQSAGCTLNTTTVRVKDTAHVSVESIDGKPLLAEGAPGAKLADGTFWRPFEKVHYEIHGIREATGAISLKCDECTRTSVELLEANGGTLPTWSWRVGIEPSVVRVSYEDECLEHGGHGFCHAQAPIRLSIPMDNVVEVRRRSEPIRFLGYVMAGASLLMLGGLAYVVAKDHDALPIAGIAAIPPLGFGAVGLWEILAPAKEQVWTPSSDKQ